ncbi:MAG TPA: Asp-tRNA(Asn)/Glu-tRNA(Gln) amidotransferase subunit GatB [Myxococcota bacterium]|nr:Asp-tRNA(Asn)/Glu-tRNA(Gln) amidotransferase subunit GatB [Myxococcota bacterium]
MNIPFESYETVIGFECHVQLSTAAKLFSKGANLYGAPPNSLLDVVDAGLPGVLPVINKKAVEYAVKLGLAVSCQINRTSIFARKHYFYPDLPKGYQISQFDRPICEHGRLNFMLNGAEKSVRIRRIHIEEDAGKSTHIEGVNKSYIDFNRAGTPLLEVVTEPDLRTPEEAMEAFRALRQLVTFLGICDGNMQEGSLRADVNVSVRKTSDRNLGTRTETKNLNSFRYVGLAIAFEARRQIIELESGKKIVQETRLWDPNAKESRAMRSKEEAHDYRYFPDPDLPPLEIPEHMLDEISRNLPELPLAKFKRYQTQFGLNDHDARMLSQDRGLATFFEDAVAHHANPKGLANWIINDVLRSTKGADIEEGLGQFSSNIPPTHIADLVKLVDDQVISSSIGKKVFAIMEKSPENGPREIVVENGWRVVSNQDEITAIIKQVLQENPVEVAKFRDGKTKVFAFLMGQVMKKSLGKLDPKIANDLLLKHLSIDLF